MVNADDFHPYPSSSFGNQANNFNLGQAAAGVNFEEEGMLVQNPMSSNQESEDESFPSREKHQIGQFLEEDHNHQDLIIANNLLNNDAFEEQQQYTSNMKIDSFKNVKSVTERDIAAPNSPQTLQQDLSILTPIGGRQQPTGDLMNPNNTFAAAGGLGAGSGIFKTPRDQRNSNEQSNQNMQELKLLQNYQNNKNIKNSNNNNNTNPQTGTVGVKTTPRGIIEGRQQLTGNERNMEIPMNYNNNGLNPETQKQQANSTRSFGSQLVGSGYLKNVSSIVELETSSMTETEGPITGLELGDGQKKNVPLIPILTTQQQQQQMLLEQNGQRRDNQMQLKTKGESILPPLNEKLNKIKIGKNDNSSNKNNNTTNNNNKFQQEPILVRQELRCKELSHKNERILYVCLKPSCGLKRLCCGYCCKLHFDHPDDLISLEKYKLDLSKQQKKIAAEKQLQQISGNVSDGTAKPTEGENNLVNKQEKDKVIEKASKGTQNMMGILREKELMYLSSFKEKELIDYFISELRICFLRIQSRLEKSEQQSTQERYAINNHADELVQAAEELRENQNVLESFSDSRILELCSLQAVEMQRMRNAKILNITLKAQAQQIDAGLYGYFNKISELLEQTIETTNKLVDEFIGNYPKLSDTCLMDSPQKDGNAGTQGFTTNNTINPTRDYISGRSNTQTNTNTKNNNTTFTQNVSLGMSTPPSGSSGNNTPMKRSQSGQYSSSTTTPNAASPRSPQKHRSSTKKNSNSLENEDYVKIKELPQWCTFGHVTRAISKFGEFKMKNYMIQPTGLGQGKQDNNNINQQQSTGEQMNRQIYLNKRTENVYIGDLVNGMKEGSGTEFTKKDQTCYTGEWMNDCHNGMGRLVCKNDVVFEGHFVDDKKNGHGVLYQFTGKRYDGYWKNDQPHGKGKQFFPNGDQFEGDFKRGIKQGSGVYTYYDGSILEGIWVKDQASGWGNLKKCDGSWYSGEFVNGKKEGYGTFVSADGRKYTGQWMQGLQHGKGYQTNQQGMTMQVVFDHGKKISTSTSAFSNGIV